MAGRLLVALLALVLVVMPAHAQTAQTGRVLLDMTIQVVPDVPSGHCLSVEAGRFIVEARLTGTNRWPVRFIFAPALNVPPNLEMRVTSPEPASGAAQVEAGVYCYALTNDAGTPEGDKAADQPDGESPPEQLVTVRLIWLPAA
jgi:hypothetical protein